MIISNQHQFIFTAIPKTGTHSVRQALRPYLAENDWEQVEHLKSSRFPIDDFQDINHGHITLSEIKEYLDPDCFKKYFKFTLVRNPFARFISYSFFRFKNNHLFEKNPTEAMKLLLANPKSNDDLLCKPQVEFITNKERHFLVDFIGRTENAQTSINEICQRIKLPMAKLAVVNETQHRDFIQYYDKELIEMVVDRYKADFELLEYPENLNSEDEQK